MVVSFILDTFQSPLARLFFLGLLWVGHAVVYGALLGALGRRRQWAVVLAFVPVVCIGLLLWFVGTGSYTGRLLALTISAPIVVFYLLFRQAAPMIEARFFTESPTLVLAVLCGLPVFGPVACVVVAMALTNRIAGLELQAGPPAEAPLPLVLRPSRRERYVHALLLAGFGLTAVYLLGHAANLLASIVGLLLALASAYLSLFVIGRGNQLIVVADGICEISAFRYFATTWDDIERFEVRNKFAGLARDLAYRTELVAWVLKSGHSRVLSGKYGFWPKDLCAYLNARLAAHRRRTGQAGQGTDTPSPPAGLDLGQWISRTRPAKLIALIIVANLLVVALLTTLFWAAMEASHLPPWPFGQ